MTPRLAFDVVGRGPRLGLVHGFTQTSRSWGVFGDQLARRFQLVRVDAPGHGGSAAVVAGIEQGAALIGDCVGRAPYLGYSMGGRYVLRLALDRPDLVERLVLIGASPGIERDDERAARVAQDEARARRLEEIGLDAFLDEWLAQPLFQSLPAEAAGRDERRANTVAGLASSLRHAGTGSQTPLWDRLAELDVPVLLLTGGADARFTETAARMAERIGTNATAVAIPGAGHAVHLERPDDAARAIFSWFDAS